MFISLSKKGADEPVDQFLDEQLALKTEKNADATKAAPAKTAPAKAAAKKPAAKKPAPKATK